MTTVNSPNFSFPQSYEVRHLHHFDPPTNTAPCEQLRAELHCMPDACIMETIISHCAL